MQRLNGREVKTLFILSIVVPIGLLTTLRFSGVLKEQPKRETVTLEPVIWEMERPQMAFVFDEKLENTYVADEASLRIRMDIIEYAENNPSVVYEGGDGLEFKISTNATMSSGLIASVSARLYPADEDATVWIRGDFQVRQNVTVTSLKEIGTNSSEPYISATITDSPSYFSSMAHWIFKDPNTEDHQLKAIFEFIYQNTSINRKVVLPLQLRMIKDVGDTFETAKNISAGEYRGCIDAVDYIDMYALTLQQGQTINITLIPPEQANLNLRLYNSSHDVVATSNQTENETEFISHVADTAGTWYLEILNVDWPYKTMQGVYSLKIEAL